MATLRQRCSVGMLSIMMLSMFCGIAESHECVHARMREKVIRGVQNYATIDRHGRRSRRADDDMEPIRMKFHTLDPTFQAADEATKKYTLDLLEDSRAWFASAIRVTPVQGSLTYKRQCKSERDANDLCLARSFFEGNCGSDFPDIPLEHLQAEPDANPALAGGAGVSDADLMVYVTMSESVVCQGNGTLAYALACNRDQIDRPTFGNINFCPRKIARREDYKHDLATAIHEIMHIIGFSPQSFALYRDAEGNPRTPRCPGAQGCQSNDPDGVPPRDPNDNSLFAVDSNTVKVSQRGGQEVKEIVTPEVRKVVRDHYGCDTLAGAELENEGGQGTANSHWEKRQVLNEFMVGLLASTWDSVKSTLSLAVLKDSGWYAVNYDAADVLLFGADKGCEWADGTCTPGTEAWCETAGVQSCTFDRTAIGFCDLQDPLTDQCGFVVPFSNLRCDDSSSTYQGIQIKGMFFGNSSACFPSTLLSNPGFTVAPLGCYEYKCVQDPAYPVGGALHVRTPDSVWHSCAGDTQSFDGGAGFSGTVSCPADWSVLCYDPTIVVPADIDECVNKTHNCDDTAFCINADGSFSCQCKPGYSGAGTAGTCADLNECTLNTDTCDANADCANTVGSFECTCTAGYTGSGRSCTDVDECAQTADICGTQARIVCENTAGSFECSCEEGFGLTGGACVDANECAAAADNNCHSAGACSNTEGSFTCSCGDGYSGDGVTCGDVDECAAGSHGCADGEVCANTVGSFRCSEAGGGTPTVEVQHLVQMVVRLPYSVADFTAARQLAFKEGVAAAAAATPSQVTINSISPAAAARRGAAGARGLLEDGAVDVDFSVEVASDAAGQALIGSAALAEDSLNTALEAQGLAPLLQITTAPEGKEVTVQADPSGQEAAALPHPMRAWVAAWAVALVACYLGDGA